MKPAPPVSNTLLIDSVNYYPPAHVGTFVILLDLLVSTILLHTLIITSQSINHNRPYFFQFEKCIKIRLVFFLLKNVLVECDY